MSWFSVLKSLLAVCIVTHFSVSSVETYECDRRECYNGRCEPNPKTCESSKGCFYKEQKLEEPPYSFTTLIENGCSEDVCTELAFSVIVRNNGTFKYDHQCCYSKRCNRISKHVSFPPTQPNGVECPACYDNEGTCKPVSLKCTGSETKCIEANITDMTVKFPPFVIRVMGCATETACNLKNVTILKDVKVDIFCSRASPQLRSISSVLISLLLMKSLLSGLSLL